MKPSRPSFLHRAFRAFPALAALALLPAAAHAASVNITVGSTLPGAEGTIWFERSNHPLRTGDTITILVPTTPAIDELSVVDGAGTNLVFNFRMRNPAGQVQTRQAHVVGVWDADANMAPENGCLAFEYTIQDTDSLVNGELLPPSGSLFGGAGIATAVLTESGDTIRSITGIRAPNPPGANTPFIDWLEPDPPPVTINQQVAITSLAVEFSTESHGTLLYNTGKNYIDFFVVTEPALNPDTLPDDFALSFQFSEKDGVRTAPFGLAREGTGENGNNGLWFRYIIQESDYSGGDLFLKTGAPLFTTASGYAAIRTADGDRVLGLAQYAYGTPDVAVATDIIVNPDNSNYVSIYFLDSDGNRFAPEVPYNLQEGDRTIKYVVDIGRVPTSPVTVTIDWGAANVFQQLGAADAPQTTTVEFTTFSSWTGTLDRILDDGAAPTGSHEYNITATRSDGANSAIMKAIVLNIEPSFLNLGTPSNLFGCPSGTNYEYAVGAYVTNRVMFSDPSYETLDEPMEVSWSHSPASTNAIESTRERNAAGGFWEATSIVGPLVQGLHTVSVSIKDKNGGNIYTNTVYYVPEPPPAPPTALLFADPSEKGFWGLGGIGDGTIEIVRPAGLTWVPEAGTPIPYDIYGNNGRVRGLPQQTADGYDSYAYRWRESLGTNSDQDPTLLDGYSPVTSLATVQLWTKEEYKVTDTVSFPYSPTRPVLYHLFSRELYRLDNFGDIDSDGLGDEWELNELQRFTAGMNWIPPGETEEVPLIASESGTPAPNYDFSGSGNLDADGLPVGCLGGSVKFQIREDGVLPMGVYDVNVFRYPLDIKNIKLFGYLPLGRDAVTGAESPEITAFTSNPYVDETAVNQIARICVNFDNLLEFRGVGTFQNVWDGVEYVSFRPFGDGDDPGTSPVSSDTDGDGLPDGWEYYFWAVAYYNVNTDQWLAFDGANPDGYTFQGTGAPIDREDILNAFRPNGGGSAEADLDNDGLSNYEEFLLGTNPIHWDTDGDGMPDGWEVEFGIANKTEQVLSTDADGNTVISIQETSSMVLNPLDPEDADSNADGDWMAYAETDIGAVLKHFDVYEAFDFDPPGATPRTSPSPTPATRSTASSTPTPPSSPPARSSTSPHGTSRVARRVATSFSPTSSPPTPTTRSTTGASGPHPRRLGGLRRHPRFPRGLAYLPQPAGSP